MVTMPKMNIAPLVEFVDKSSIARIFCFIVGVPFVFWLVMFYFIQHDGSTYEVTDEVEFDISIGGELAGTFVIGLFGKQVPDTVENFRQLAGAGHDGHMYQGTVFHRVVKGFLVQGGDVTAPKNTEAAEPGYGRYSIYGETFVDENFAIEHTGPYFVGMANTGPDSNACQFYIATCAASWLNGKHVIFGKVVRNDEVVTKIEEVEVDPANRPIKVVKIAESRVKKLDNPYSISTDPYNIYSYFYALLKPFIATFSVMYIFSYVTGTLSRGIEATEATENRIKKQFARMTGNKGVPDKPAGAGKDGARKRNVKGSPEEAESDGESECGCAHQNSTEEEDEFPISPAKKTAAPAKPKEN